MRFNERTIFLLDGLGALSSALGLAVLLPFLGDRIGLETRNLYALAGFAGALSLYSLTCFGFVKRMRPVHLLAIIVANLCYCGLTGLIIASSPSLTFLGRLYFIGEIMVILGIVFLETRVYRRIFAP